MSRPASVAESSRRVGRLIRGPLRTPLPDEAAKRADWIQILTPDETMGDFFEASIKPALKPGKILGFSHGFGIHFKTIVPPAD